MTQLEILQRIARGELTPEQGNQLLNRKATLDNDDSSLVRMKVSNEFGTFLSGLASPVIDLSGNQ